MNNESSSMGFEEKLIKLEILYSEQENIIETLNEVLTKQQLQINKIENQLKMALQILNQSNNNASKPEDEPPPPHY